MKVALISPFDNPHCSDIFRCARDKHDFTLHVYCYRDLPMHRKKLGWSTLPETRHLSPKHYLELLATLRDYDHIVLLGAVDPVLRQLLVVAAAAFLGVQLTVVSEGLRHRGVRQSARWKCVKAVLNSHETNLLCIGHSSAADFRWLGLQNPRMLRFGFAEKYNHHSIQEQTSDPIVKILGVGQLISRKNFNAVVESLCELSPQESVRFSICGGGPEEETLLESARSLPTNVELQLLGNCTQQRVQQEFQNSDIFVMPSLYDGWGVVLNQAISNHKPVIVASGVRSAQDHLVVHNENGLIYTNEVELRNSLQRLIADRSERARMSRNSKILAEVWSIDSIADRLGIWLRDPSKTWETGPLSLT